MALGLAACGGDDEPAAKTETAPTETLPTVTTPTAPVTTPAPATTPPVTGDTSGGATAPSGEDSPTNDIPPPPNSPAERFERECERNPEACG